MTTNHIERPIKLPPTVLEAVIAYLVELGPEDEIVIPWSSLNKTTKQVKLETMGTAEKLIISTVDIDDDGTDPVPGDMTIYPPVYPAVEGRDLGASFTE